MPVHDARVHVKTEKVFSSLPIFKFHEEKDSVGNNIVLHGLSLN